MKIIEENYIFNFEVRIAFCILFTLALIGVIFNITKIITVNSDNYKKNIVMLVFTFSIMTSCYFLPYFLPKYIQESPITETHYKVVTESPKQIDIKNFDIVEQPSNNIYILKKKLGDTKSHISEVIMIGLFIAIIIVCYLLTKLFFKCKNKASYKKIKYKDTVETTRQLNNSYLKLTKDHPNNIYLFKKK